MSIADKDHLTAEAMAYEDALEVLATPGAVRDILARALQHAKAADEAYEPLRATVLYEHGGPSGSVAMETLGRYRMDLAATFDSIAHTAIVMAREEREASQAAVAEVDDEAAHPLGDDGTEPGTPDDGPRALACRFTAEFMVQVVGRIGGREMGFLPHLGWIDVTRTVRRTLPDAPGQLLVKIRGRAVSRYNGQVLVITDDGLGMVLPVKLVKLEPDE